MSVVGSVDRNLVRLHKEWAGARVLLDARLVKIDPVLETDQYCVIQALEKNGRCANWMQQGTTGSVGEGKLDLDAESTVRASFMTTFEHFTGVTYKNACNGSSPIPGRFEWLELAEDDAATQSDTVMWEYYVDNGVDNKADGWYQYDEGASAIVDELYHDFVVAKNGRMRTRFVKSGYWTYEVDLETQTQRNTSTNTKRQIRRTINGEPQDFEGDTRSETTETLPSTPTRKGKTTKYAPMTPPKLFSRRSRFALPTPPQRMRKKRGSVRRSPRIMLKNGIRRSSRLHHFVSIA